MMFLFKTKKIKQICPKADTEPNYKKMQRKDKNSIEIAELCAIKYIYTEIFLYPPTMVSTLSA